MSAILDNTGKKVQGAYIGPDGHARLADGKPIPAGYHVQTDEGKMYTMGTDGVGRLAYSDITKSDNTVSSLPAARLYTAKEMGELMGIDTDVNHLVDKYQDAANAKYDKLDADYKKLEGKYGDNMSTAQNVATDTIRRQRSDAIQEGYSSAKEMASVLSAIMGVSQAGAEGAKEITQSGEALKDMRASDVAQASIDAETEAQRRKEEIGKLIYQLNSNDVQRMSVDANLMGTLDANKAGLLAQYSANATQKEIAAMNASVSRLLGTNPNNPANNTAGPGSDIYELIKDAGPNLQAYLKQCLFTNSQPSDELFDKAKDKDEEMYARINKNWINSRQDISPNYKIDPTGLTSWELEMLKKQP